MKKASKKFLLVFCCLATIKSVAQIVNMETERFRTDTIGWSGSVSGAFSISDYGEKVTTVNAASHVQYKTSKSLYLLLGNYGFLKGDGKSFVDFGFLHFRYNYKLSTRVRLEAFTQVQQNAVTKIDSRFLVGVGPRVKISDKKAFHCYVATAAMYEREKEAGKTGLIEDWRSSSYLSFTLLPNQQTELTTTTYYQPVFFNASDYRFLNQSVFKIKASRKLAVALNWSFGFDSLPAEGVQKGTYSFSTGLELSL